MGDVPFGDEQLEVARNLSKDNPAQELEFLEKTSQDYKDFVLKCLSKLEHRMTLDECFSHPLLVELDFDVEANEVAIPPPFVPSIGGPEDTSHFEDIEASELRAFDQRNKRQVRLSYDGLGLQNKHRMFVSDIHACLQVSSSGFDAKELQWMGFTYSCEDAILEGFGSGLANTTMMANGDESMLLEAHTKELDLTKEQRDRHMKAASEAKAQLATMKWRMTTVMTECRGYFVLLTLFVGLEFLF